MSSGLLIALPLAALTLAAILTPMMMCAAHRVGAVDRPSAAPSRKVHQQPTPLLGGIAVFIAVVCTVAIALAFGVDFSASAIKTKHLFGIGIAGFLLMVGGALDDRWSLRPSRQLLAPIAASIIVIASGIGIVFVTNPFGGQLRLDTIETIIFWHNGIAYKLTLLADVFTFLWLMGMTYTTKFLDGLDGLVSGITVIGAVIIGALALDPIVHQSETALFAFIVAGAFSGFLLFNRHPARIFLGEGGSLFAGFILGVLAILSGSKVATTVLIFAIPIFDSAWVLLRRIVWERRSPFLGDKKHLHFRLLDLGLSQRAVVYSLYGVTAYIGIATLFLQSRGKGIALLLVTVALALLGGLLVYKNRGTLYKKNEG